MVLIVYIGIGILIGMVVSDYRYRKLRMDNRMLRVSNERFKRTLIERDKLYQNQKDRFLDLRRRYDKIYSNKYGKKD